MVSGATQVRFLALASFWNALGKKCASVSNLDMQIFVTGLGGVVMLAAVIAATADCQKTAPLMGKNKSQCGGFYTVLGKSSRAFAKRSIKMMAPDDLVLQAFPGS